MVSRSGWNGLNSHRFGCMLRYMLDRTLGERSCSMLGCMFGMELGCRFRLCPFNT